MKKFEYQLLDTDSNLWGSFDYDKLLGYLDQMGGQGWEVVTVTSLDGSSGRTTRLLVTFKREMPAG